MVHSLLWSSFPSSLPNFFTATNFKDHPTVNGKHSAKCRAELSAEHWMHWTPISNVAMPSLWVLPIHNGLQIPLPIGLSGWTEWRQTLNSLAPPFNHISGICQDLADTWPAVTGVLSRGRERTLGTRLLRTQTYLRLSLVYAGGNTFAGYRGYIFMPAAQGKVLKCLWSKK